MDHPGPFKGCGSALIHAGGIRACESAEQILTRCSVLGTQAQGQSSSTPGMGPGIGSSGCLTRCLFILKYNKPTSVNDKRTHLQHDATRRMFTHVNAPLATAHACTWNRPDTQQAPCCASASVPQLFWLPRPGRHLFLNFPVIGVTPCLASFTRHHVCDG